MTASSESFRIRGRLGGLATAAQGDMERRGRATQAKRRERLAAQVNPDGVLSPEATEQLVDLRIRDEMARLRLKAISKPAQVQVRGAARAPASCPLCAGALAAIRRVREWRRWTCAPCGLVVSLRDEVAA